MEWWTSRKTLNDYFVFAQPLPTNGGLFYTMRSDNPPWGTDASMGAQIDALYMTSRGDKYVSAFVTRIAPDAPFTARQIQTVSAIIMVQYRSKWERLWALRNAEYEPLENYNMTENEDYGHTDTTNRILTREGDLYGFNSATPAHTTKNVDTETNNTLARIGDRDLTRTGNIGTMTTQQMLKSDVDLWNDWDFWNNIFDDVDRLLTMPIY